MVCNWSYLDLVGKCFWHYGNYLHVNHKKRFIDLWGCWFCYQQVFLYYIQSLVTLVFSFEHFVFCSIEQVFISFSDGATYVLCPVVPFGRYFIDHFLPIHFHLCPGSFDKGLLYYIDIWAICNAHWVPLRCSYFL